MPPGQTALRVGPTLTIPPDELRMAFSRSSGPGGQNVNKVESRVELRWNVAESAALSERDRSWLLERLAAQLTTTGELIVTSERHRTQARNRADALEKLASTLRDALVRPKRRRPTRPGKRAVQRRLDEKKQRGELKRGRRDAGGGDD